MLSNMLNDLAEAMKALDGKKPCGNQGSPARIAARVVKAKQGETNGERELR